mmetsp:Transcript_23404/g.34019  ORF Transcript_23404/g.34019 Transcript_23404/m.34019 type:complete len:106 (-) Transcript_23404:140-457(-)
MPLFEMNDWNEFIEFMPPKGAKLVAVEMGGQPLETFEHPAQAIYVLGSEDTGLPKSVTLACHEHISLPSERYDSYNVAMAGSIVLYDRLLKEKTIKRRGKIKQEE